MKISSRYGGMLLAAVFSLALVAGFGPMASASPIASSIASIDLGLHTGAAPPLANDPSMILSSSFESAVAPELLAAAVVPSCNAAPTGEHSGGFRSGLSRGALDVVFHGMTTAPPVAQNSA